MFAVCLRRGQDGDRPQGAGASARGLSGDVVRLSRLSETRPFEASVVCPHPAFAFGKERRGPRNGCWELQFKLLPLSGTAARGSLGFVVFAGSRLSLSPSLGQSAGALSVREASRGRDKNGAGTWSCWLSGDLSSRTR